MSLSSLFDVSDLRILSLTVFLALTGAHICARTYTASTPTDCLTEASKYLKLVIILSVQVKNKWLPCTRQSHNYYLFSDNMLHLHGDSYIVGIMGRVYSQAPASSNIFLGTQDDDLNIGPYPRLLCQQHFP